MSRRRAVLGAATVLLALIAVPVPAAEAAGPQALAEWSLAAPASGALFLTARLRGTPGRSVVVTAGGRTSAPVHLDGTWQAVGVTFDSTGGQVGAVVSAVEEWSAGDVLAVEGVSVTTASPSTSSVVPGTRVITVNGSPVVLKGTTYWPTPVGEHWPATSWADPATCQNDARLLAGMGANVLRLPFEDYEPALHAQYVQCLDAFWANGLGVQWDIDPPSQGEWFDDDPVYLAAFQQKVRTAIEDLGSHPASWFWLIGNEIERSDGGNGYKWMGNKATGTVGFADQLFAYAESLDPTRLVGTSLAGGGWLHFLADGLVPHLQVWGINTYVHTSTVPFDTMDAGDPRPKFLTEFGVDRYHCVPGLLTEQVSTSRLVQSCKSTSAENQQEQATWDREAWDLIASRLATTANPNGSVSGGMVFYWSDEWWFSLGVLTPSAPFTHDVAGVGPWEAPDGLINTEWHGVSYATLRTDTFLRGTTLATNELGRRWRGDPPSLTSASAVASSGCAVTVTWTTDEPATTDVQYGLVAEVFSAGSDMVSDNTLYRAGTYDPAYVTSHSAVVTGLLPGLRYRVVPRSFASDGRYGTLAPITVTCPLL